MKWLFSDPVRASLGLAYLVVFLTAIVLVTWLLAPHLGRILGTLVGAVAGLGAVVSSSGPPGDDGATGMTATRTSRQSGESSRAERPAPTRLQ